MLRAPVLCDGAYKTNEKGMRTMKEVYQLPADAMLYAVLRLHKPGIYGLPNVMPKLSDKEFPAFAQDAELELMGAGCGVLNFDGEFALEPGFAALLSGCADCQSVVGASLQRGGGWQKLTLYPAAGAVLERAEDFTCTLRPAAHPMEALLAALALPEDPPTPLPELLVDTDLLEKRDLQGVMAAGCCEAQAEMILAALNGTGGYAHISRVEGRARTGELLLFYGQAGILAADAEYSETQEFLRLRPLAKQQALAQLHRLECAAEEQEGLQ